LSKEEDPRIRTRISPHNREGGREAWVRGGWKGKGHMISQKVKNLREIRSVPTPRRGFCDTPLPYGKKEGSNSETVYGTQWGRSPKRRCPPEQGVENQGPLPHLTHPLQKGPRGPQAWSNRTTHRKQREERSKVSIKTS